VLAFSSSEIKTALLRFRLWLDGWLQNSSGFLGIWWAEVSFRAIRGSIAGHLHSTRSLKWIHRIHQLKVLSTTFYGEWNQHQVG
jgi:hypothetical protein